MSAVAEPHRHADRRPAGAPQRAGAGGRAGARRRQQHRHRLRPAASSARCWRPTRGSRPCRSPCMVLGMWFGTLPIGWLARHYGRRFALQIGIAVRRAVRADLLRGGDERLVRAAAARHVLRRALCRGASVLPLCRRRYRERAVQAEGDLLGAGRRRVRGVDRAAARHLHQGLLPPHLFAASYLGAGGSARCSRPCVLMFVKIPPPPRKPAERRRGRCRDRAQPRFIVAVACGVASYAHDEHGDDLGAARHGRLRPFGHRCRRSACNGTCWRCSRRASSPAA